MNKETTGLIMIGILTGILLTFIALWIYSAILMYGISPQQQDVLVGLFCGAGIMFGLDRIDWEIIW